MKDKLGNTFLTADVFCVAVRSERLKVCCVEEDVEITGQSKV